MSADLEGRLRRDLRAMADRVEPAPDSWSAIHRRSVARSRRRHRALAVAAAAAVVVTTVTATVRPWEVDDRTLVTGAAWSVEDLRVRDRVQVGPSFISGDFVPRASMAGDGGAVWFTRLGNSQIFRLDPVSASVRSVVDTRQPLVGLTVSPDAVWAVADGYGEVVRLDRVTAEMSRVSLEVGGVAHVATGGVAYLDRAVWVAATGGRLLRVDLETGATEAIDLGVDVRSVTAGGGALWGVGEAGTVFRFDPRRRQVTARADLGEGRFRIEHGEGATWVLDVTRAELVAMAPDLATVRRVEIGPDPYDVAVGAGAVWVTDQVDGALLVVDPGSGEVRRVLDVGGRPGDAVVVGDDVWINDPDAGTLVSVALR